MQFDVWTTDPVHMEAIAESAESAGVSVRQRFPKDPERGDVQVVDLDFWDAAQREELLRRWCESPLPRPTAVFSYQLSNDEAAELERNGVHVARNFDLKLFDDLLADARAFFPDAAQPAELEPVSE